MLRDNTIFIEDEMKSSYLDYAMSVITSRALPDVRDGLKPVHRRILYAMHETNNYHDKPYKKSARVVGDVMGKYHPHGDMAIYSALVRLAQDFSLNNPLIDGQGNFGSMDGDAPAQMRYTEVRLDKISNSMLEDIVYDTVDFNPNYDGSENEPSILPCKFPNLLVNGTGGIAVGMATNIPTHNLGEIINASIAYIENPDITVTDMVNIVPGPDFPTGGIITNPARAKKALIDGRGSVAIRSKTSIEEIGGRSAIVITEIPFQVNKAEVLSKIELLLKSKVLEGIQEIRDETNKLGVRVVIELKRGVIPDVILNQLFKHTALQSSFAYNMLALDKGIPQLMNIKSIIKSFIQFREEVVTKRSVYLLNKARVRAHILIGLSLAVTNIDHVIQLIRSSRTPAEARTKLLAIVWDTATIEHMLKMIDDDRNNVDRCQFTEEQVKSILDMKLQRLTALEHDKIKNELDELSKEISKHLDILASRDRVSAIIKRELLEIRDKFTTERRTQICSIDIDLDMDDLIPKEDVVVTITMKGYIKRSLLSTYRAQARGGKGKSGMKMHKDDATNHVIATTTHSLLLFFSNRGRVYKMKVYGIQDSGTQSKGRALVNLLPLDADEVITNIMPIDEYHSDHSIIFATANGKIRRNSIKDFENINQNGKIAINLGDNDSLIGIAICEADHHVMISTKQGKSLRFCVNDLRVFRSRTSDGVRAIKLSMENDSVVSLTTLSGISMQTEERLEFLRINRYDRLNLTDKVPSHMINYAKNEEMLLSITENGYGKRTSAYEYRVATRGGQGIGNIDTSERNGGVIAVLTIAENDDVIIATSGGTVIRMNASSISTSSRNTKGVKIINLNAGEKVISATKISEL